jgi:cytochrome c oxidase subunit 3
MTVPVASHFQDLATEERAARLGMWVFLASEILFFAGLFALYAAYRTEHPSGFALGIARNTIVWGSANTAVLLVSSYTVALAVHALRRARVAASAALVGVTVLLGACFLAIKTGEYWVHFREGIYPGAGSFFRDNDAPGTGMFFTLYFGMTGLHAIHVLVGMGVLITLGVRVARGQILPRASYPLALGAVYWHLVDVVWIFLWPLFYLTPGGLR